MSLLIVANAVKHSHQLRNPSRKDSFGSRWWEVRLLCVLKHHLYFWEHWHCIPVSKGNLRGFLLALIAVVPEMYSETSPLHHISDACHAPFDILQCCALCMTPSFPLHHLAPICSAANAFQIIHLVTGGRVTYHPPGNESSYHEGHRKKRHLSTASVCCRRWVQM